MPTFYRPANKRAQFAAVVWNPKANAPLAEFGQDNTFTTEDPFVISELKKLGYPTVEEYEATQEAPSAPPPLPTKPKPAAATPAKKQPVEAKRSLKRRAPAPQATDSMDSDVSPK